QGTATGNKGESTYVVGLTRCFHLLFGFTNCSNFGVGVDNVWNDVVVHHSLLASNTLSDHHTFFRPFVCQHRAAHNVTDSPDTRRIGRAQVINVDEATLIQVHATVSSQQTFGVWTTTHAHDQFVEGFFLLFAVFVSVSNNYFITFNFRTGYAAAGANIQTLFGEDLHSFFCNLLIHHGEEAIKCFQYHNFRTQAVPHTAQLKTDNTSTNHTETLRYRIELQRTG